MSIHPYNDQMDRDAVLALLAKCRAAHCINRELTMARLQLLIATRLNAPQDNSRLWKNNVGQLQAATFLLQRAIGAPLELTYFIAPGLRFPDESQIVGWALQRGSILQQEQQSSLRLLVLFSERLQTMLEQLQFSKLDGFAPCLGRSLEARLPDPMPIEGFSVSSLSTQDDTVKYTALYSAVMSPISSEQRQSLMSSVGYLPELNLVIQSADGALVAFGESSLDAQEGWLEHIGVCPDYQRQGLGQLIVTASLAALKAAGARQAFLMTSSTNDAALGLYTKLGFETVERNWIYARTI